MNSLSFLQSGSNKKKNIKLHKYFNGHTDKKYKIMLVITSVEMAVSKKNEKDKQKSTRVRDEHMCKGK